MRILAWTEKEIEGLSRRGLSMILTEIDDEGVIMREIGISDDDVRYASSAAQDSGFRGFFDLQSIYSSARSGPDEFPRDLFEEYWSKARS